jgi:hypothetical protein
MVLVARSVLSLVGAIELARLPMLRYAWHVPTRLIRD